MEQKTIKEKVKKHLPEIVLVAGGAITVVAIIVTKGKVKSVKLPEKPSSGRYEWELLTPIEQSIRKADEVIFTEIAPELENALISAEEYWSETPIKIGDVTKVVTINMKQRE